MRNVIYIRGSKFIRYGNGYIDPEDHGGLTGKPTVYHIRFRKRYKKKMFSKRRKWRGIR